MPERAGLERFTPATTASNSIARATRWNWRRQGRKVAVVSGGDPGVFGMAAAVFEAIETGEPAGATLDIRVIPGVSAVHGGGGAARRAARP